MGYKVTQYFLSKYYCTTMADQTDTVISILPTIEIKEGTDLNKLSLFLDKCYEKVATEDGCVNYSFGFADDNKSLVCRESYKSAAALQAHLDNFSEILAQAESEGVAITKFIAFASESEMPELKRVLAV